MTLTLDLPDDLVRSLLERPLEERNRLAAEALSAALHPIKGRRTPEEFARQLDAYAAIVPPDRPPLPDEATRRVNLYGD